MGAIDEAFDQRCIAAFNDGREKPLVEFLEAEMDAAGNGSHECRNWIVAHGAGYVLAIAADRNTAIFFSDVPPSTLPPKIGFDLWVVYVCWIVGVLLLYPVCRWYAGVKARRRDWWLSYL